MTVEALKLLKTILKWLQYHILELETHFDASHYPQNSKLLTNLKLQLEKEATEQI